MNIPEEAKNQEILEEFLDIQQTYFEWPVFKDSYYWDDEVETLSSDECSSLIMDPESFEESIISINVMGKGPYLLIRAGQKPATNVRSLESAPALFRTFAETPITCEDILKFANTHGLLTKGPAFIKTKHFSDTDHPKTKFRLSEGLSSDNVKVDDALFCGWIEGESFDFWRKQIQRMK